MNLDQLLAKHHAELRQLREEAKQFKERREPIENSEPEVVPQFLRPPAPTPVALNRHRKPIVESNRQGERYFRTFEKLRV